MVENNFYAHENLRGEFATDRAKRHGYSVYKDLGGGWHFDGIIENIGYMPTGNVEGHGFVGISADQIAEAQVESWMNSPGHRKAILGPNLDKVGIGVAFDGKYYFSTQNFW